MPRSGTRKYRCSDCGAPSFVHWTARDRHTATRCPACGSSRLGPDGDQGLDDILSANTRAANPRDASIAASVGSISVELLDALEHRDFNVRRRAIRTISALLPEQPRFVAQLAPLLRDEKASVRQAAIEALAPYAALLSEQDRAVVVAGMRPSQS